MIEQNYIFIMYVLLIMDML